MQKEIYAIALVAILATSILSIATLEQVDAKKPVKPVKCNNIKIIVKVSGVEENKTYTANVSLGTGSKTKSGVADDNISLSLPVMFKKIQPCPAIGFQFNGDVNGTDFQGTIKSLKKPNKVTVDVS